MPGWVGAADLVIAVSCSGTTEETLSATAEAVRRGCRWWGGRGRVAVALLAEQARAPFIPVQPAGMPRFTLWGLAVPLMQIADRLGVADIPRDAMETPPPTWSGSPTCAARTANPSCIRQDAGPGLDGTLPMIWGSSPLTGVAATGSPCQLNENAKYPAIRGAAGSHHNQWSCSTARSRRGRPTAVVLDDEDPRPACRPPGPSCGTSQEDPASNPQAAKGVSARAGSEQQRIGR